MIVTADDEFDALAPAWERLWRADPRATPFQHPAWLRPWWRHVGEGTLLTLAVPGDDGELDGLAPMYVYPHADGRRSLFPVGIATSDFLEPLCRPGREQAFLAEFATFLKQTGGRWDDLEWPQLRPTSVLAKLAGGEAEACPALDLRGASRVEDAVPRKLADNLRTYRNRAAREGGLSYELVTRPDQIAPAFDALLALHAARWNARDEPGVLADPGVVAKHREALPGLLDAGLLRLSTLRVRGQIAAVAYNLIDPPGRPERRFYYYLNGIDPALARLSPGTLLIAEAMRTALDEGCRWFDFLRGREAYKYLWGAADQPTRRITITADRGDA